MTNEQVRAANRLDRKLEAARELLDKAQFEFAQERYHTAAQAVHKAKRGLIDAEIMIERHSEAMASDKSLRAAGG